MRFQMHSIAALLAIVMALFAPDANAQIDRTDFIDRPSPAQNDLVTPLLRQHGLEQNDERGVFFDRVWTWDASDRLYSGTLVDVEGNIIVITSDLDSNPRRVVVEKLDGAENSTPSVLWTTEAPYLREAYVSAVDLDGNIFIAGNGTTMFPALIKVSPEGLIQWQRTYLNFFSGITDLLVDSEGVVFVSTGNRAGVPSVADDPGIYQINPMNGAIGWGTNLEAAQTCIADVAFARMRMDSGGNLYVSAMNAAAAGTSTLLARLDAGNGEVAWCSDRAMSISLGRDNMATDADQNIFLFGQDSGSSVVEKIASDGTLQWRRTMAPARGSTTVAVRVGAVDREGAITMGGNYRDLGDTAANAGFIIRYLADGTFAWQNFISDDLPTSYFFTVEGITSIALDRFGNAYATAVHVFGTVNRSSSTSKWSRLDGVRVWADFDPLPSGFTSIEARSIIVDAGSNVLSAAAAVESGPQNARRVIKYTQPFTGVPTTQCAAANLTFEDQSLWAPGAGNLVAQEHFFTESWTNEGIDIGDTFTIPLLGDFGGGFDFITSGTLSMGAKAEVDGGTCDVQLPFTVDYTIPDMAKLSPGSPVTINVDWTPDPAARITSCFTPTVNAGLTAGLTYSVRSGAFLTAFSESLFDVTFVNIINRMIAEDYVPGLNLLDILSAVGFPVPGEWFSIDLPPKGLFTAEFRTPQMFAQGTFDPSSNSFRTVSQDRFFVFGISVTEALLKIIGATATFEFDEPGPTIGDDGEEEDPDFGVSGSGRALQLITKVDMGARQQIDVGVVPMVHYAFSDGVPSQTIPITQDLSFTLPNPFDGHLDIVPTVVTSADFMNRTAIEVFPGLQWITLEFALAASAFGFEVLSFGPECIFCYDWDLAEILEALGVPNPTIVNLSLDVFDDSWQIPFDPVELPCLRVNGSTATLPHLVAASRDTVSMIIYDQTSPSPSSFNVSTDGVAKMLFFGERLNSTSVAQIEHWGRNEALPTTWINDNTLLVEVPNRFRLLPGVAKLHVTTNFGVSESIDLTVAYPKPRLDAVNPNLWAADPDLAVLPIAVIDAKSFAGNDTFIARRDYFIKMRDELWSDITDDGFAGGAQDYFPLFDFNQLPAFPAVMWPKRPVNDLRSLTFTESDSSRIMCNPNPQHNVTAGITVESLVRVNSAGTSGLNQVMATTDLPRAMGIRWGILADGRIDFTTLGVQNYHSSVAVPDDVWTHVAVVFDTGGEANYYINGEYAETINGNPTIINNASAAVLIGGDAGGNQFVGDMAEVRFWNVMRTPEQIASNYDRSLTGTEAGLIGYWPLQKLENLGVGTAGANDVDDRSPVNADGDTTGIFSGVSLDLPGSADSVHVPLPRFVQPVDNGIHNVRLAESQYDRPQAVPVYICNPGPGGGKSNELILTIAAPIPVATAIEPATISPTDIEYEENYFDPMDDPIAQPVQLRITGPNHVPTLTGWEEPKYGNFNADSVVRFNGIDLATTFVSSSLLYADLPPDLIEPGNHSITVFTPSNGTQYFEEKWIDANMDGIPDAMPAFQGLIDSGGESAPLLFPIAYRQPRITRLSPPNAEVNSAAFDDAQLPMPVPYNITLVGSDFRDGCVVYFNGQPRDTLFMGDTLVRAKLLPQDVAVLGEVPVTVQNPGPDFQAAPPRTFEVLPIGAFLQRLGQRQDSAEAPRGTRNRFHTSERR
ncbi:MAG: hypothetical protein KDA20_05450 [Phycisphaerales bacterium]|nr:hypothetical protein [Phycisphaerales bacterium]